MKKETRFCDVCRRILGPPFLGEEGMLVKVGGNNRIQDGFTVLIYPPDREESADLCDRDRLRVLEAAVEQMRVAHEAGVSAARGLKAEAAGEPHIDVPLSEGKELASHLVPSGVPGKATTTG